MLARLSVEGFKSLLTISDLELGRVNVFIGANGSGKTGLLESVGVLGAAVAGDVSDRELSSRGVRLGTPALYKTSLQGQPYRRTITLQAVGDKEAEYRVSLDNPIEDPAPAWRFNTERLLLGGEQIIGRSPRGFRLPDGVAPSLESIELQP
jgi:recombinational DNA repair ATPase RecF